MNHVKMEVIDDGLNRGERSEVKSENSVWVIYIKNSWNSVYKGNYAEISYQERKVEGHSLEKTPGREMLCDLK